MCNLIWLESLGPRGGPGRLQEPEQQEEEGELGKDDLANEILNEYKSNQGYADLPLLTGRHVSSVTTSR